MRKQVRVSLFFAVLRMLLIISMLANLSACTKAVHQDSPPIPRFDTVAIVNKGATDELKARFGVAPGDAGSGVETGALAGAGAGAAVGAHVSLVCVGFVFLCAVATVPFGAAIGALVEVWQIMLWIRKKNCPLST